ncbi:MAG: SAM-dependent methyltransferase [Solirubrobacterales bacterium]
MARTEESLSRPRYEPSVTADINAAERAAEMHQPPTKRLFTDPYAHCFVRKRTYRALCSYGPVSRTAIRLFDRVYGGNHAHVILRNHVYERELAAALADGVDQVVLLGAGYDSTAFRRSLGSAVLFEVDSPHTQRAKLEAIRSRSLAPRCDVRYVPCDFESDRPGPLLVESGFDSGRPSLVVWFGVMYYLTEAAVRQTLDEIARFSGSGSRLLVDYQDAAVSAGTSPWPGARRAYRSVKRRREPLRFGLTESTAPAFVGASGFVVRESLRVTDLASRYGPPGGVWCSTDDWFGTLVAERP